MDSGAIHFRFPLMKNSGCGETFRDSAATEMSVKQMNHERCPGEERERRTTNVYFPVDLHRLKLGRGNCELFKIDSTCEIVLTLFR